MQRERTIVAKRVRCINPDCPNDAKPGQLGGCSRCGQAIRRRLKQGKYKEDDLVARGKIVLKPIDDWLRN